MQTVIAKLQDALAKASKNLDAFFDEGAEEFDYVDAARESLEQASELAKKLE
jgi:hypothetical protein